VRRALALVLLVAAVAIPAACSDDDGGNGEGSGSGATSSSQPDGSSTTTRVETEVMELGAPAFEDGALIPPEHTCAGAGTAPELRWNEPPEGTEQVALIVFDPDARGGEGFVHYVGWDIDADARRLDAAGYAAATLGKNDTGGTGWVPACPPPGEEPHRYEFTIYALGEDPGVEPGADKYALQEAIGNRILGQATVTGRFGR
jgi:Raf kinase inhibitor-like YbhB/YbcL family protein